MWSILARRPDVALTAADVMHLQEMVNRVTVEESLVEYMLAIVERTRNHESLTLGALAARAGGAPIIPGALRVLVWGALVMVITGATGALFGTTK